MDEVEATTESDEPKAPLAQVVQQPKRIKTLESLNISFP